MKRTLFIPDIHGSFKAAKDSLAHGGFIVEGADADNPEEWTVDQKTNVVLLGDIVDRGTENEKVLRMVHHL